MGKDDEEPPASPSNEQSGSPGEYCEYCGTAIDTRDWYPVTKARDSDGSLQLFSFCSEECHRDWFDENPDR